MKSKKITALFLSICLIFSLVMFTACGKSDTDTGDAADGPRFTIGVSQANVAAGAYYGSYRDSLIETAKELNVELVLMDANSDAIAQNSQVDDLIQKKVDGMIIWPVNDKTAVPAFQRAYEAGIPALDADVPMPEEANEYMIGFSGPDHFNQAYNGATKTFDALVERDGQDKTFNIVELMGMPGDFSQQKRSDGYEAAMKDANAKYGEGTFVLLDRQPADFSPQKAQKVMEDYLHKFKSIDGVLCVEGATAVGSVNAIQEAGRALGYETAGGILICEGNAFTASYDLMTQGLIFASTEQSPRYAAKCALTELVEYLDGTNTEPVFVNYFDTPSYTMFEVKDYEKPVF